jgi:hypothetical protein
MRSVYISVYKHGIVQYIFSVQVIFCYKNSILHRQTVNRLTEKVMPFKNKCEKLTLKNSE